MRISDWSSDVCSSDLEIVLSKQSDGQSRVDLKIGDLQIYMSDGEVMKKWLGGELGPARTKAHLGLDHFGLSVDDVAAAIPDLVLKSVQITFTPTTFRPVSLAAYTAAQDCAEIEIVNSDLSLAFVLYRGRTGSSARKGDLSVFCEK